jgi:hypothetical protein
MVKRAQVNSPGFGKQVSVNDVFKALRDMDEARERLDWRRRDLRLMFIQNPELGRAYDAFQRAGGVTATEWEAYSTQARGMENKILRPHVLRKRHLRLIAKRDLEKP